MKTILYPIPIYFQNYISVFKFNASNIPHFTYLWQLAMASDVAFSFFALYPDTNRKRYGAGLTAKKLRRRINISAQYAIATLIRNPVKYFNSRTSCGRTTSSVSDD